MPPEKSINKNNHNIMSSNNSNIPKFNGTQACAACKYQRRKCAPDCILAPYFPHDRQRQFLNAHKLFGVSNITKIIRNLDQPEKDEAMRTIIFQSDVRASDPVGGCYRIIRDLQRQIDYYRSELEIVYHHLDFCRAQAQAQAEAQVEIHQQHQQQMLVPDANNVIINGDPLSNTFEQMNYHEEQFQLQEQCSIMQNDHVVALHEVNSWGMQESTSSSMTAMPQPSDNKECDHIIRPLLDLPLDRQELRFESDESIDQSRFKFEDEDTIGRSKEAILAEDKATFHDEGGLFQHAQHHDLKGAATYFSLTNCNS